MRVLIVHHLEKIWEDGYNMFSTTFEALAESLVEHCNATKYDHVILTRFEDFQLGDEHYDNHLEWLIDEVHDYAYGWQIDSVDDWQNDPDWTEGGSHSEIVYVPDWIKQLAAPRFDTVDLCGAFEGECIEDMEIALSSVNINFNRIENLIIG